MQPVTVNNYLNYMEEIEKLPSCEKAELDIKINNINNFFELTETHYNLIREIAVKGYVYHDPSDYPHNDIHGIFINGNIRDTLIKAGIVEQIIFKDVVQYILSDLGNTVYVFRFKKNPLNPFQVFSFIFNIDRFVEKVLNLNTTKDIEIILKHDHNKEIYFILKKATKIALMLEGIINLDADNVPKLILPSNLEEYKVFTQKISNITTRKILLIVQAMKNADTKNSLSNTCPPEIYNQLEKKNLSGALPDNEYKYIAKQLTIKPIGTMLPNLLEYITLLL